MSSCNICLFFSGSRWTRLWISETRDSWFSSSAKVEGGLYLVSITANSVYKTKIKGNQRLDTNGGFLRGLRSCSVYSWLECLDLEVFFNAAFCNRGHFLKRDCQKLKPKWWHGEMEPVDCMLKTGTNLGAADSLEWQLHFKERRNFMHSSSDKQIVCEQHCKGLKYQNNTSRQYQRNQRQCPVMLTLCVTANLV